MYQKQMFLERYWVSSLLREVHDSGSGLMYQLGVLRLGFEQDRNIQVSLLLTVVPGQQETSVPGLLSCYF
jgi:hypothetical protein